MEDKQQMDLFKVEEWWEKEWKGMPEFVQKDLTPHKTIYVHFENIKDLEEFSKLVGQNISMSTRSIWFPQAEIGHFADKRWIDDAPPAVDPEEEEEERSEGIDPEAILEIE